MVLSSTAFWAVMAAMAASVAYARPVSEVVSGVSFPGTAGVDLMAYNNNKDGAPSAKEAAAILGEK